MVATIQLILHHLSQQRLPKLASRKMVVAGFSVVLATWLQVQLKQTQAFLQRHLVTRLTVFVSALLICLVETLIPCLVVATNTDQWLETCLVVVLTI